jgi:hypothetical protein
MPGRSLAFSFTTSLRYNDCAAEADKEDKIIRLRICTVFELWAELQGEDLAAEEKFLTFIKTRVQTIDGVRCSFCCSPASRAQLLVLPRVAASRLSPLYANQCVVSFLTP